MMNTEPKHWCRAWFELGSNCDSVDNNMCESFNNSIVDARFYPVISMLEAVRRKVMVRIQENRGKANKWQGIVCPNIFKKLKMNIERSSQCHVLWNGNDGFEVKEKDRRRYTVNLQNMTCSCIYWQLSRLPCCHALSAIYKSGQAIDGFIAQCYSIQEYKKTYDHCMEPVEGEEKWPTSDHPKPSPPGYVKMPGRPKGKARKREPGEKPKATKMSRVGTVMRCGLCHKTKHNSRGCPLNKERGKKKNALVTRANRKRKQPDGATSSTVHTEQASHRLQAAGEGTIHRLVKTSVRSSKKVSLKGKPTGPAI